MSFIELKISKKGAHDKAGVWLFSMVRNEEYFLPHFLLHYKELGISNFLFYDDHSVDGTMDILSQDGSCTVVTSDHRFN